MFGSDHLDFTASTGYQKHVDVCHTEPGPFRYFLHASGCHVVSLYLILARRRSSKCVALAIYGTLSVTLMYSLKISSQNIITFLNEAQ